MNNKKSTKRALLSSVLSLVLCMAMLIGTTFAWFTDNASTGVNTIQSGRLDIALEYSTDDGATWLNAEGKTLNFMAADGREEILWEPGCTYELPLIRVRNNGNLALKYELTINGVTGDAKLLEAIEFTANGNAIGGFSGTLLEEDAVSDTILIKGHMKEEATNEYQDLSITGIGITVSAIQHTYEKDSYDEYYDDAADAVEVNTVDALQAVLNDGGYAVLTADIDASKVTPKNQAFKIPQGKKAVIDLNGHTLTSYDGGRGNNYAIYIDRNAQLKLKDSVGTGQVVASCYGVYIQPNAKFIMDGGTINVSGNGVYDMGVTVWNAEFVMNGGAINSQYGVWVSNYYRDVAGETGLNRCSVTIADGCNLTSTGYADVEYADALDAIINVPEELELYPTTITTADELVALGGTKIDGTYVLGANIDMAGKNMKSMEVSGGANVKFIGNGHTISNLTLGAAKIHGMTGTGNEVAGLFDLTAPATTVSLTVSDLTIKNATVACSGYAAAIVGYNPNGGTVITLNNVDVSGAQISSDSVAALVGYTTGKVTLNGCDVSNLTLTGQEGRPEKVGAFVGTANTATCVVTVTNCTNSTTYNDYGRVINGATYQ